MRLSYMICIFIKNYFRHVNLIFKEQLTCF